MVEHGTIARTGAGPHAHEQDSDPLALRPSETWPFYAEDEVATATAILRSGKVNQWTGKHVVAFEDAYASHLGVPRAIALANGSVALELALRAFGIGAGDEVIVTPRSFVASAFCVMLVGARPVFADVDPDSGNITPETIAAVLTPRTRAIIPVHLAGWPCDMPGICALARDRGILVIEDCAQAHGAEIGGAPVGSFGDAAAFSFCQDKIITTAGEGGLVVFQDARAAEWAWSFKDHGKNAAKMAAPAAGPGFRWVHDSVGTNWRMLEISAAIGSLQLAKLPDWRALRTRNAGIWANALRGVPGLRVPVPAAPFTGAFYKFYAYLPGDCDSAARRRDALLQAATARGIRAFSGSCPEVYREAAFAELGVAPLAIARELGETSLMFEVHPTLDPDRLRRRANAIAEIISEQLA